jgi:hypothetical protein
MATLGSDDFLGSGVWDSSKWTLLSGGSAGSSSQSGGIGTLQANPTGLTYESYGMYYSASSVTKDIEIQALVPSLTLTEQYHAIGWTSTNTHRSADDVNTSNGYLVMLRVSSNAFEIWRGSDRISIASSGFTYAANTAYNVVFRKVGAVVSGWIWTGDPNARPASPTVTFTDSAADAATTGRAYLAAGNGSAATTRPFSVDSVVITDTQAVVATGPAFDAAAYDYTYFDTPAPDVVKVVRDASEGTDGAVLSAAVIPSQSVTGTNGTYYKDPTGKLWYQQELPSGTSGQWRIAVTNSKKQSFSGRFWPYNWSSTSNNRVVLTARYGSGNAFRTAITPANQLTIQIGVTPYTSMLTSAVSGGMSPSLKYWVTLDYQVGSSNNGSTTSTTGDSSITMSIYLAGSTTALWTGSNNACNLGVATITHYDVGSLDTVAQAIGFRWTNLQWANDSPTSLADLADPVARSGWYALVNGVEVPVTWRATG